jgi:hypothetical protein
VGRLVGKALYDGQLIDAYFTRSFYKHVLGQVRGRGPAGLHSIRVCCNVLAGHACPGTRTRVPSPNLGTAPAPPSPCLRTPCLKPVLSSPAHPTPPTPPTPTTYLTPPHPTPHPVPCQPLTYVDLEAVDPGYYKNLAWMLEHDITGVLEDLTFT